MSSDGVPNQEHLRRLGRSGPLVLALAAGLGLSGCETMSDAWKGTTNTVGGWFESDDPEKAGAEGTDEAADAAETAAANSAPASGGLTTGSVPGMSSSGGAFRSAGRAPDLNAVPSEAPKPPSSDTDRKDAIEGLVADRERAQYTEQSGRREPVTVRPLVAGGAPPAARPQAEPETRSAATSASAPTQAAAPTAPVAPRTTALAERLGAAPPPPPPPEGGAQAPAPSSPAQAAAAPQPLRPTTPAPAPAAAPQPAAPLIATPRPAPDVYGEDTVVIDGTGVRAGDAVQQFASAPVRPAPPRAAFDPGNASVSSQIGTVVFASGSNRLSASAKAVLADVAQLRADVDGAIRVEAGSDERAQAITAELKKLGVPANRLYAGGGTGGEEADIYLDY